MKKRVLLTGATGSMGQATLKQLITLKDTETVAFVLDTPNERNIIKKYRKYTNIIPFYGDLTNYQDVLNSTKNIDIILHIAALVSPVADDQPTLTMKINYGSTVNLINAIKEHNQENRTKFIGIGSIAMTGDRLPPIHWGRVGDPLKPSVHDYYAVSKIAAEKALIESGLKYWVSLRQTGIISAKMANIKDPIIFHQPLDNVMEYITDHDSGILMKNICIDDVPSEFWGHIYNIGGGECCRINTFYLINNIFKTMGFSSLSYLMEPKWFALRNFHGTYFLDSDRLNNLIPFRSQGLNHFYTIYQRNMGVVFTIFRYMNRLPGVQKVMGGLIKKTFSKLLNNKRGSKFWITNNKTEWIDPFYISKKHWEEIPSFKDMKLFTNWNEVVYIDHGYDESKPESELELRDIKQAAEFRGGIVLSNCMSKGDWSTPLEWRCAFGHDFKASPRLILEAGHWCPVCEHKSWNYHEIAKVNPFFAQVWYPLHDRDEPSKEYIKDINI